MIGVLREDVSDHDTSTPDGSDVPERPQPTLAALPGLIEESRAAGVRVVWENEVTDAGQAPANVGRNAYRIVQEGLTNVRKHAPDTAVTVTVDGAPGAGLTVEIRNRLPVGGQPGPTAPGAGSGLVGLAERASLAGGRLEHGYTTDDDFRLRAWLPWPA